MIISDKDKERLFSKILKTDSCWLWIGALNGNGYGNFGLNGEVVRAHRVMYFVHFGAFDETLFVCHRCDNPRCVRPEHLFLGSQADNLRDMRAKGREAKGLTHGTKTQPDSRARGDRHGLRVHPECAARGDRHRSRTHPETLLWKDDHFFRRHPELFMRGSESSLASLTREQVRELRSLYAAGKHSYKDLAALYSVATTTVGRIVRRETYCNEGVDGDDVEGSQED